MHKFILLFAFCLSSLLLIAQDEKKDSSESAWSFTASGYYYWIPYEKNFLLLTGIAEHKSLHLEARYNYEDLNTASAFAGWKFEAGNQLQLTAVPMFGFAFGNTNGAIPALELELSYKIFDFYSEAEYLIDFSGGENNFFYTWTELGVSPLEHFRTGISIQKTRVYQTEFSLQRGIFAEYSFWKLTVGAHLFDPFSSDTFGVFLLRVNF